MELTLPERAPLVGEVNASEPFDVNLERAKHEGRLVLERGPLAGRAYRVKPKICGNPICMCQHFGMQCFPEGSADAPGSRTPLTLELDLESHTLTEPALSDQSPASTLAKGVLDEITSEQWDHLGKYFFACKAVFTEIANLDELDTDFPPDAGEGSMVGYYQILPFARPISFTAGENEWVLGDAYCLRPSCGCRAAFLQAIRITPDGAGNQVRGPDISFRYNYETQSVDSVESSGTSLPPAAVLTRMRQLEPDFDAFLSKRHNQLRQLYRLFAKRHGIRKRRRKSIEAEVPEFFDDLVPQPVRAAPKPGRNDPCPCGSGKKYKKCCGSS